jgi:hypothetical protein
MSKACFQHDPEAEALAEAVRDLQHDGLCIVEIPALRGALRHLAGMTGKVDCLSASC